MPHAKGVAQVFHPLLAVEPCLRRRVAGALEGVPERVTRTLREQAGEDLRLVEIALAKTRGMERHRDDRIERLSADAVVIQRLCHPVGQRMAEVKMTVVFETMDELTDHAAAEVVRDCALKM